MKNTSLLKKSKIEIENLNKTSNQPVVIVSICEISR